MACDNNYYVCKQTPNTILDEKCVGKEFDFFLAHLYESSYYPTHIEKSKINFYKKNSIPINLTNIYVS